MKDLGYQTVGHKPACAAIIHISGNIGVATRDHVLSCVSVWLKERRTNVSCTTDNSMWSHADAKTHQFWIKKLKRLYSLGSEQQNC